jgi:haloalkane dehalogenase
MISEGMQYQQKSVRVLGCLMAYVDAGEGYPVVFLHGNPTSSYVWRNVIPHLTSKARCIAPDLIGLGDSEKLPEAGPDAYTFAEHRRYLDELFASLGLERKLTFVCHDWGSVLAFDWARRHPDKVRGIAFMEAIVKPMRWERWSAQTCCGPMRTRSTSRLGTSTAGNCRARG